MPDSHSKIGDLDFHNVQTFLALARLENFSRAGQETALSQSGVSRRIRALEESLGVRLFQRIGRRAVLTGEGRIVRARFEALMREAATLPRLLADLAEGVRGELRVGACITAANALLPSVLGLYRQRYPNVDLVLQPGSSGRVLETLERGEVDIGFVALDSVPLHVITLAEIRDELVLVGRADHPLCRRWVKPTDLTGCDFIHRESSSDTRRLTVRWLERNRIQVRTLMDIW